MNDQLEVEAVLPGDPELVGQLAASLQRAAGLLRSAVDKVTMLGAQGSVWEGPVAQGFLDHMSDLSRRIGALEADLAMAASQLSTWREGLAERRQRLLALQQEMSATAAAGDGADLAETDRQQAQLRSLVDEHEAAGATLAQALRQVADTTTDPARALDGSAWLVHAEALLRELDHQIGSWVSSQGAALTEAVSGISQSTAVSATVAQAAGSWSPGLDVALGAAVVSVAATAPGSHRLVASARRAQKPIPLDTLPVATFAPASSRK